MGVEECCCARPYNIEFDEEQGASGTRMDIESPQKLDPHIEELIINC